MQLKVTFLMLILVCLLSVSFVFAASQAPQLEWSNTYYGESGKVIQTTDGCYAVAGTNASVGFYPAWERAPTLTKTDSTGMLQWNLTYDTTGHISTNSIMQTQDGGYILSGSSMQISEELKSKISLGNLSDLLSGNWNPPYEGWIIKTGNQGNVEWSKTIELPLERCYVIQTSDKNYVLTGYTATNVTGVLIKLDENGNTLWTKTFGENSRVFANTVLETDNGYVVGGSWDRKGWLMKTDLEGNSQWNKHYVIDESNSYNFFSVANTSDNGYILAGGRLDKACLVKINSSGNMDWNRIYPASGSLGFTSVVQTSKGYIAASSNNKQAWLAIIDVNGNFLGDAKYGDTDENVSSFASSIIATNDGGFAVSGTLNRYSPTTAEGFQTLPPIGNHMWLAKFAPEPNASPSPTVPEFTSIVLLLIALTATLTLVVLKKKRSC